MPNWHGMKEMWVPWMFDPCCDFQLWPRPWPWLWIFNVKFWNSCIPWVWGLIDMERKGYESIGCYTCYVCSSFDLHLGFSSGCGLETFLSWWPLQPCGRVLKFFMATTGDVWIIPSFLIWWLCAACWAHFMCHHKLWPTSVSHPFSFLNIFLGLAWGKHYLKITIPIYRLVLQNFANPGYFLYFPFCRFLFSLLSSGWVVIAVCDYFSPGN